MQTKPKPKSIRARFSGKDKSCGFRNGEYYDLWIFQKGNKIYLSKQSPNSMAIPYDTIGAFLANWTDVSQAEPKSSGDQLKGQMTIYDFI